MKKVVLYSFVVLLIYLMMPLTVVAQETITVFAYDNSSAVAEEGIKDNGYGDKDTGYLSTTGEGWLFASVNGTDSRKLEWSKDDYDGLGMQAVMTGGNKNPWGNGAYLEVRVSTIGYEAIIFSAQLGATKKGPRDYQLQYSLDGITFTDVGATYSLTNNKTLEQAFDHVALPSDAAGCDMLYIRMTVASDILVNGTAGLYGSTSGETAVGTVVVYGTKSSISAKTTTATANNMTTETEQTSRSETQSTSQTTSMESLLTKATGSVASSSRQKAISTTVQNNSATSQPASAQTSDSSWAAIALVVLAVSCGGVVFLSWRTDYKNR